MTKDEPQKLPQQPDYNVPGTWTKVSLIEPSTAGYVHVGARSGSWRLPIALPRARRRWILDLMQAAARGLRADPGVTRADVFEGLLRPPGEASHWIVTFARTDWRELPWASVAFVARAVANRVRRRCEHSAPTAWPPADTFRQLRELAETELPGARVSRLISGRVLIHWQPPASQVAA